MIIHLKRMTQKDTINCGAGVHSDQIITEGKVITGYFGAVVGSAMGHLTMRMWISDRPGGEPLDRKYSWRAQTLNAADTGHRPELKLSVTTGIPKSRNICRLEKNKVYWLNHEMKAAGGEGPTAASYMIRNINIK